MADAKAEPMIGGGQQVSASREERRPKRKYVEGMRIKRAENGGFTITHEYASPGDGPYEPSKDHVFGKPEAHKVLEHIGRTLRIPSASKMGDGGAQKPEPVLGGPVKKADDKPAN